MIDAEAVILRLLSGLGVPVPATKLVKLVYLVDYVYFQHYGRTLTGFQYQWDHYGPNAVGHAIIGEAERLAVADRVKVTLHPNIYGGTTENFALRSGTPAPSLPTEAEMVVEDVLAQYGKLSVPAITSLSKRTAPFKNAAQYALLSMDQPAPPERTMEGDWEAYQRDLKETGGLSLDEVTRRYGLP